MYCYGSGAGYGRFIDRVEQPLFVPGQKGTNEHNAKLKAELEEERKAEGRPKNMDAQADKQHGKENEKLHDKSARR